MNKRILMILLCVSIIFTFAGCTTKYIDSKDSQISEGDKSLIINSNLMNQLAQLGPMYEFVALKYNGGVVNGIISPIKVEKDIEFRGAKREHRELEPIIYKEYSVNALDKRSFPVETGSIIKLSEIPVDTRNNEKIKKLISTGKGMALEKYNVFEVNEQLYYFENDGKIYKIIFDGVAVGLVSYYNLELGENETLNISNLYDNNIAAGENIFVEIVTKDSKALDSKLQRVDIQHSVLNMEDKTRTDIEPGYDIYTSVEKIFSNSENLIVLALNNNGLTTKWIAKYEEGKFNNLVKIDKYNNNATNTRQNNIDDILYDDKTNSFFIKRLVKIDKKQSYQYEVLKLE